MSEFTNVLFSENRSWHIQGNQRIKHGGGINSKDLKVADIHKGISGSSMDVELTLNKEVADILKGISGSSMEAELTLHKEVADILKGINRSSMDVGLTLKT
ncbi:hypothetical protein [Shewanella putrefaciens]|uniref:hypothetical protein n=1 Tax=Shewanella putrefaciens TaxID=24 RepID=UPI0018E76940|nr:hypothetical protein [Shewanella putrefaciens]